MGLGDVKRMKCDQLAGLSVRLVDKTLVIFEEEDDDGDGVSEPARPKNPTPAVSA